MFFESKFLGRIPYSKGVELMNQLRSRRLENKISDTLLFLEHDPVITMGRRESENDLRLTKKELYKKGIGFVKTDRGGKLTYHGPGQLVGYFIFNIEKLGYGIDKFVWQVEEGLRLLLESYCIYAIRDQKNPGLWIKNKKIVSLGFHVHKGVTTHGIALNVHCNLTPFTYMVPCGVEGRGVTSMLKEINIRLDIKEIALKLKNHYGSKKPVMRPWRTNNKNENGY